MERYVPITREHIRHYAVVGHWALRTGVHPECTPRRDGPLMDKQRPWYLQLRGRPPETLLAGVWRRVSRRRGRAIPAMGVAIFGALLVANLVAGRAVGVAASTLMLCACTWSLFRRHRLRDRPDRRPSET